MKRHGYRPKRTGKTPRKSPSGGTSYGVVFVGTPRTDDGGADGILAAAKPDLVNAPPHYRAGDTYETIRVIEAWGLDFCLGNTVKYISRAGKKDAATEIQDLEKSAWYLARRIQQLKGGAK